MAKPKIIPFEDPIVGPAIKQIHVMAINNIHSIGRSKIIQFAVSDIVAPIQDGFSLPKKVLVIDRPVSAGFPMIVSAQEENGTDPNPCSFSSFNKLQASNNARVQCMSEDILGILWFDINDNRVSKHNGKSLVNFNAIESYSDDLKVEKKG